MLYFSQKTARPPATAAESGQLTKVLAFKEEFEPQGLLWSYEDETQFGTLIRDHLTQHVLERARERKDKPATAVT
jgi:hypothetical protein